MKKFLLIIVSSAIIFGSFTGCNQNSSNNDTASTTNAIESTTPSETEEDIVIDNKEKFYEMVPQGEIKFDPENTIFEFSPEEIKLYEDFSVDFDKKKLVGADAFTIAKIWLTYGIAEAWESEYALYDEASLNSLIDEKTNQPINLDKQSFYNRFREDVETEKRIIESGEKGITRKELAQLHFSKLVNGEFIEEADGKSYIKFENSNGDFMKFLFVKNPIGNFDIYYYPIVSFQ